MNGNFNRRVFQFCIDVIYASGDQLAQVARAGGIQREALRDRAEIWHRTADRIREIAPEAQTMDDLPQWLLDLGDQLGVRRPVDLPQRTYPSVLARIEGDEMYLVALDQDWGRILNRDQQRYWPTGLIGTYLVMTGPWEFLAPDAVSPAQLAEWIAAAQDMEAEMTSEQCQALAARRAAWEAPNRPLMVEDDENADWPKRTWDLPTDKAEFLAFRKASRTSVAEFKTWPIYRWHVDKIPWLRDLQEDDA